MVAPGTAILALPPPSTSGPGRHPFKVVARVRIPLGAFRCNPAYLLAIAAVVPRPDGDFLPDVHDVSRRIRTCFQDDPSIFIDGRFEGEGDHRTLVVPGGIGADLRMRGKITGSPVESGGSGFVRVKSALAVLQRNKWFEVEQTVGELRIRIGERARKLRESLPN